MRLRTYARLKGDQEGESKPEPWPFLIVGGARDIGYDVLKPGDTVEHFTAKGQGLIIAITDDQLTILWSVEPTSDFSRIAYQLVSVQSITLPSGLIFYMDYQYGSDKLTQRCNTGPWPLKMFWRAYRWSSNSLRSCWAKLRSSGSSLFGIRRITAGASAAPAIEGSSLNKSSTNNVHEETLRALVENQRARTGQPMPPESLMKKWLQLQRGQDDE